MIRSVVNNWYPEADTVLKNGNVLTINKAFDIAESVAIKNGRIVYVGSNENVKEWVGNNTEIYDLKGNSLLPGFIDSHVHFNNTGFKSCYITDISSESVNSISEIRELVKNAVKNASPGDWILLQGYDQNKLKENRHPNKHDFDDLTPNNPLQCSRCCNHMAVYNSYAMKLGGINNPSNYPEGHVVVENGEITGLLKENTHMLLSELIHRSNEQFYKAAIEADKIFSSYGITSVHDAGIDGFRGIGITAHAAQAGEINTKIYQMIFDTNGKQPIIDIIKSYLGSGLITGFGNSHYRIGPVKLWMDGSTSGPSSLMNEPYCHNPNLKGLQVTTQEEADELIIAAHCAGFQVTGHAVGDKAVDILLSSIRKAYKKEPRKNCRHRIEHAAFLSEKTKKDILDMGIVPVPNPGFITINGQDYKKYYGNRAEEMFPLGFYLNNNIISPIGSDSPVHTPNPMHGIYGAITRNDIANNISLGERNTVDVMQAIKMYTLDGAYASFEEDTKGSIEIGKCADLVVLSENILEASPKDLLNVKAEMTFNDGNLVYHA